MKSKEIQRERFSIIFFLVILLVAFVFVMTPFLMPMVLAAIITMVIYPWYGMLKDKLGNKPRLASLMMTLLVLVGFVVPSSLIATALVNELYQYIGSFDLKQTFSELFTADWYVLYVEPFIADIEQRFQIKIDLLGPLTSFGKSVATSIYDYSPSVLMGTATFVFNFFIMMVGIYFLLVEGPALLKVFFDLSPLRATHERRLSTRLRDTIDASIYGYLVTALVQAIIAGILFAAVGLDTFVMLGTLTFFMSMVPVIGAAGVWVPVCVWFFLQSQMWEAFAVLVVGGLVVSGIDNFLKPIIIEGRIKVHPLLIFFSLFGGITLFGPVGILFGPVITALLIAVINIYREEFL